MYKTFLKIKKNADIILLSTFIKLILENYVIEVDSLVGNFIVKVIVIVTYCSK